MLIGEGLDVTSLTARLRIDFSGRKSRSGETNSEVISILQVRNSQTLKYILQVEPMGFPSMEL